MKQFSWKSLRVAWQTYKPLGWSQLIHRKTRLLIALMGVAFSNILIFTQLGLRAMLFEGITLLPNSLAGDLFLISAYAPTMDSSQFARIYLYQADAVAGVDVATALYIRSADWVNPEDLTKVVSQEVAPQPNFDFFPNEVKVLAFNPVRPALAIPEVRQQLVYLNQPNMILFDRLGQSKLGPIPEMLESSDLVSTLMEDQRVYVAGLFSLGSTLLDNGHVVTSDWNYKNWFGSDSLKWVNVGCLTLTAGADVDAVRTRLRAVLPDGIRVLTKAEVIDVEQSFQSALPEGKVLNFGAVIGFIVGVVVVYQVLYTDVSEHLPEYATLKAMGYADRILLSMILQEALALAVLGFIPGYLASYGVYHLLVQLTRVPLVMKASVALQVFGLTLIMCSVAGMVSMNKLRSADPADVF